MGRIKKVFILLFLMSFGAFAQNNTYLPSESKKEILKPEIKDSRKVLVIPFEPKLMYMSEIDQNVYKETNMNFNQIQHAFRSGLDFCVVAEFKKKFGVVSLMNDTGAAVRDQHYIYNSIAYKYDVIPTADGKAQKDEIADKPKIQNGQLAVQTNEQSKFMNVKITNPNLLSTLNKRYGTDVFVFISELDLKMVAQDRMAYVHYSIYDLKGNLVTAGLATMPFPASANDPKKIVNSYFTGIAEKIRNDYMSAINPKTEKGK
jgi:hypothetical protein